MGYLKALPITLCIIGLLEGSTYYFYIFGLLEGNTYYFYIIGLLVYLVGSKYLHVCSY
jgi:hypothetical protein